MTQKDRILRLLQQRGKQGLNTTDLLGPVADGGKPILRLAARIRDLQQEGHRIRSERKINGTATYFLHESVVEAAQIGQSEDVGSVPPPAPTLFDPTPEPVNAALQDFEEDAA